MADPDIIIRDNPDRHRFEADLGDAVAIAEYNLLSHAIMFTHTEVPQAYEGRGIGTKLIEFAMAAARERGLQVIPICPFFAAYMKDHAEVQDLLTPAYARILGVTRPSDEGEGG
jgi:predicted GNAT family acetyltransferase